MPFLKTIYSYKYFLILLLIFIFSRFAFLTKLPVFNDEAIYIDWGWRMIHLPNELFYSLYDGKQPFLMWLFGYAQSLSSDPLWMSRCVSAIFAIFSFIGVYVLTNYLYNKKTAYIASILYLLCPLFLFFDRQALMESSLTAIGIWSVFLYLKLLDKPTYFRSIILGITLGIGFFIKSTSLIFSLALLFLFFINIKKYYKKTNLLYHLIFALVTSQIILVPLYQQAAFGQIFNLNNRFTLTVYELLHFPILHWIENVVAVLEISFWHFTPFILIPMACGFFLLKTQKEERYKQFGCYIFFLILIFIIFTRSPSPRYLVSLTPLLLIPTAVYVENKLLGKLKWYSIVSVHFLVVLCGVQIVAPTHYLARLNALTKYSQANDYLYNWTAGKAGQEAASYLKDKSKTKRIVVGVRSDAGNPENTIFYSFNNDKNVNVIYFDQNQLPFIGEYACLKSDSQLYFVARDSHLANTQRFWLEEKRFFNSEQRTSVGVYKNNENCIGNTLTINFDKK